MPPPGRLHLSRESDWLIVDADAVAPIRLKLDTQRKGFRVNVRYVPTEDISVAEWTWTNGSGGAGTSIETRASYETGSCEYGEFVWLRRKGAAQPAGKLTELVLPAETAAKTSGKFWDAAIYGADLWITTLGSTVVKIPNRIGTPADEGTPLPNTEQDFSSEGANRGTVGIVNWSYGGAEYLEVSDPVGGIHEFDGTTWSTGQAGTIRGQMTTTNWTLGDQMATGGAAGTAGSNADRLVATDPAGTGIYHVAGDPKTSANWSSITRVGPGSGSFPIQRLLGDNHTIWASTGMGIYGVNGLGYAPNLTKGVELIASPNSAQAAVYWDGLAWYAHEQGLMVFALDGSRIDMGSFLQFGAKTGTTPIFGLPRALAPTPDGLMVGYYNGTDSYIGCLVKDPDGTYRWSMAECVIRNQQVSFIRQATGTDAYPRLFIGTTDATGHLHLYTQWLPRSGDPESDFLQTDGPFEAAEDWSLRLSKTDAQRAIPKTHRRWSLEYNHLGADYPSNTIDFQVSADGGDFVSQGTATTGSRWTGTPTQAQVRATNVQIKLVVHNAKATPVVIYSVGDRYSPHPENTKITTYPVLFGNRVTKQDPKTMLTRLERKQRQGPSEIVDALGRQVRGTVEPNLYESWEMEQNEWVVHADVTISTTQDAARFDVDVFDAADFA